MQRLYFVKRELDYYKTSDKKPVSRLKQISESCFTPSNDAMMNQCKHINPIQYNLQGVGAAKNLRRTLLS